MALSDDGSVIVHSRSIWSRRCCLVSAAVAGLALIVIAAIAIPVVLRFIRSRNYDDGQAAINAACQHATSYPDVCNQILLNAPGASASDSRGLTMLTMVAAQNGLNRTHSTVMSIKNGTNENVTAAVEVCGEVLASSVEQLDLALSSLRTSDPNALQVAFDSIKTRASAALELHTTCVDAFLEVAPNTTESNQIVAEGAATDALLSNALAFINAFCEFGSNVAEWKNTLLNMADGFNISDNPSSLPGTRRPLLNAEIFEDRESWPAWMSDIQKCHLRDTTKANVVVASDGSGDHKTIQSAVSAAPATGSASAKRYVIYVKSGVYDEQVRVPRMATNLMIVGDGSGRTVITGSRSVALTRGMTTFQSATLIIQGPGFIGKYFTSQNTAGAAGHQAVALRVSADKVAFYNCSFESFQDTLYAHISRQFYRECTVLGTVDFIFGNGNAVFQSCNIVAKKSSLDGQQNTYTAQGRTDPHQNTGLSFQNCTFAATPELQANVKGLKTYLGRPWKSHSVCVLLRCTLDGHIDPSGWLPWNSTSFGLKTSFFAEFHSTGAGATIKKRVSWSHQITKAATANHYQASQFIQGAKWLPSLDIPFTTANLTDNQS